MTSTDSRRAPDVRARELVSNPLVLRAAWLRIDGWYRSGNLAPQPELSRWRLHPEGELRALAVELADGTWSPAKWPQIPYPKKGRRLRHYVLPSVKDQVAFMAHAVLLGPIIDSQTHPFAFGNRWYRPILWDQRHAPGRWVLRPYPLFHRRTYLPYARSHGLFRRVAHWTAARMTGAEVASEDYRGRVPSLDDYDPATLPRWLAGDWWNTGSTDRQQAYWAELDIQLAYPSVRLEHLTDALEDLLTASYRVPELSGYPGGILEALGMQDVCVALSHALVTALGRVRIKCDSITPSSWAPVDARSDLPPEKDPGLPTGLAVSGLLLNAVLHPSDTAVMAYLEHARPESPGAILRFADDMILLSRSQEGLLRLVETAWTAVSGDEDDEGRPDARRSPSNLYINLGKIGPKPFGQLVLEFLKAQEWKEAPGGDHLEPPEQAPEARSLVDWWMERKGTEDGRKEAESFERTAIDAGDLGPFVTSLVSRLSEIGRDTLSERFGEAAVARLAKLHELARLDIDDAQVRPDTRRTFAANRLVRAWLPGDGETAAHALDEIRVSVGYALRQSPWKFSLWRAVVRGAARRPAPGSGDVEANEFLEGQLVQVGERQDDPRCWMVRWPTGGDFEDHHRGRDDSWRALYLSFHRAAFWHALAGVQRQLWRHMDWMTDPWSASPEVPSFWWTVRAIPEGEHGNVIAFLSNFDRWLQLLFPEPMPKLTEWEWELDALVDAIIASVSATEIARAFRRSERPTRMLCLPSSLPLLQRLPHTRMILGEMGRLIPERRGTAYLDEVGLSLVALAGRSHTLPREILTQAGNVAILRETRDPNWMASAFDELGCGPSLPTEFSRPAYQDPASLARAVSSDPSHLWEYLKLRRAFLGSGGVL